MDADEPGVLRLSIRIESEAERAALEQALLRARATELGEVRRRNVRLVAGYGDDTARGVMSGEADRAELRRIMLDRVLSALRDVSPGSDEG